MLIVQMAHDTPGLWSDLNKFNNEKEVEDYISGIIKTGKAVAEKLRVVDEVCRCEIEVKLIKPEKDPRQKRYTDEEMLLIFFKKSCQKGKWINSADMANDPEIPYYSTYTGRFGRVSNIIDKVIYKLKNQSKEYIKIAEIFCKECGKKACGKSIIDCLR